MRVRGFACDSVGGDAYQRLLDAGFRRSGRVYYQPACDGCRACVPLRVPVLRFTPSRSQRRAMTRNRDLTIAIGPPEPSDEKHELYVRYLLSRHDGAMSSDRGSFDDFLYRSSTETIEMTYRDADNRLLAAGICDLTPTSVSTVYFYSEPDAAKRSLGTFGCLQEIELARRTARPHYYLGYWIAECGRMSYKVTYRPCEALGVDGRWREVA